LNRAARRAGNRLRAGHAFRQEAVAYMKKIHSLVRYLEICDGNMQEGSFRCDANVSVRPKGQREFGTRAELKILILSLR